MASIPSHIHERIPDVYCLDCLALLAEAHQSVFSCGGHRDSGRCSLDNLAVPAEARNSASADSVQWQRKGVPLHIVQSQGPMERTLTDLVALAKVLYQEEQKAFHAAMEEDTDRSAGPM